MHAGCIDCPSRGSPVATRDTRTHAHHLCQAEHTHTIGAHRREEIKDAVEESFQVTGRYM